MRDVKVRGGSYLSVAHQRSRLQLVDVVVEAGDVAARTVSARLVLLWNS